MRTPLTAHSCMQLSKRLAAAQQGLHEAGTAAKQRQEQLDQLQKQESALQKEKQQLQQVGCRFVTSCG